MNLQPIPEGTVELFTDLMTVELSAKACCNRLSHFLQRSSRHDGHVCGLRHNDNQRWPFPSAPPYCLAARIQRFRSVRALSHIFTCTGINEVFTSAVNLKIHLFFYAFQSPDDARQLLKHLDPTLGVELPEKDYGGSCLLYDRNHTDPYHNIWVDNMHY